LADVLARVPVRMAVNREYVEPGDALHAGDELALITPISGGSDANIHARISAEPPLSKRRREVRRPSRRVSDRHVGRSEQLTFFGEQVRPVLGALVLLQLSGRLSACGAD
jgi:ThiS family